MTANKIIRVGGASGFWGESDMAVPQFLAAGNLDYIVFDYLAEITMSIMARARAKDPQLGYAPDFVSAVLKPNLAGIAKQKIKIISNAGGVNPAACGAAIRALIAEQGLDLKVAVVLGDDLLDQKEEFAKAGLTGMFSGEAFPDPEKVASINAYLGAFPIAEALEKGADIVITGRCVDSAVTLAACIHAFGWKPDDLDQLAGGSLAGHIIECGPQSTGGNFTDWEDVANSLDEVGYPIAEISADGSFVTTKSASTGGAVTVGTVGEQMLYEIGDPQAYILPDVICDFSNVFLEQVGKDRVRVSGTTNNGVPGQYKVSTTFSDGWKIVTPWFFIGEDAANKARSFADAALKRTRRKLRSINTGDFDDVLVEVLGDESHYGVEARNKDNREVILKLAAKHQDPRAAGLLLREATGLALAAPPGLTMFSGGRPKPSPVVRLLSLLIDKNKVAIRIDMDGEEMSFNSLQAPIVEPAIVHPEVPVAGETGAMTEVPLIDLAWGRSGDKGNKANVGILPRSKEFAPWIWAALTCEEVARRFGHFLEQPDAQSVERFYLPGTGAINFLLHDVLGGGGIASMRNDPQGKSYAQILLQASVPIPASLLKSSS